MLDKTKSFVKTERNWMSVYEFLAFTAQTDKYVNYLDRY